MKTALALIFSICLLGGVASGQTLPAPAPLPPPGIILTPPQLPADSMQSQSCPDTGRKLELIS